MSFSTLIEILFGPSAARRSAQHAERTAIRQAMDSHPIEDPNNWTSPKLKETISRPHFWKQS